MSGNAIETLREKADLFVPTGFRDEDGVWHDGPHRIEFDTALAAVEALLEAAQNVVRIHGGKARSVDCQPVTGLSPPGDPLDRIEAEFDMGGHLETRDVLALVEVARAARERVSYGHDRRCDSEMSEGEYPCTCGQDAEGAALARLGKGQP